MESQLGVKFATPGKSSFDTWDAARDANVCESGPGARGLRPPRAVVWGEQSLASREGIYVLEYVERSPTENINNALDPTGTTVEFLKVPRSFPVVRAMEFAHQFKADS